MTEVTQIILNMADKVTDNKVDNSKKVTDMKYDTKVGDELVHTEDHSTDIKRLVITKVEGELLYYDVYDSNNKKRTSFCNRLDRKYWRKLTKLERALR